MFSPQLALSWDITPNLRRVVGTAIELAGWYAYQNKTALLGSGWTLIWTSNGTTGPANAGDNADRISSESDFATRNSSLTAPQSYFVVENTDGVQMLFTYNGTDDRHIRVSYSLAGFTLAGTTTHAPTAADECVISALSFVVDTTSGFDNVMSIWTNTTHWRCAVFRNNAILRYLTFGKHERLGVVSRLPLAYVASKFVQADRTANGTVNVDSTAIRPTSGDVNMPPGAQYQIGTSGIHCYFLRIINPGNPSGVNIRAFGGAVVGQGTATWSSTMLVNGNQYPASLGGNTALVWPIIVWGEGQGSSIVANADGPWAKLLDWFQVMTQSTTNPPIQTSSIGFDPGDTPGVTTPRTNWLVALGAGALWPWRNVAPLMEIA